ncbi:type IV pilus assembly protein PilM [Leifsonia aquatica]|uniref:type IV pilus assembly protein PilM n=1 Tax=Leifsonia aquatica TaxID=144185 RepID=UPI0004699D0C|nr:type IV pilus assembly protein PilM [Leifsonia aquatica]
MANSIVGLDIGNSVVRAVEVSELSKAKPQLVRFQEAVLPEGAVSRGEVLEPNTVAAILRQMWGRGGFRTKDVALGVGNQRVLARDLTVPKGPLQHIRESLPFHVQDLLPVPVAEALLDFYPVSEGIAESGPVVNGLLVAAVKEVVLGNIKAIELAGLHPVGVDLIPFALNRLLVGAREDVSDTVVLVDVGANTTSVVISSNGAPQFVRIIPTGGSELTEALRSTFDIPAADAEARKRALGLAAEANSPDEQRTLEVIYQVTGELLSSLRNTVNYYANTRPGDRMARIVLTGGGADLPGFSSALAEMTRLPVEVGDPFASIGLSRRVDAGQLRTHRSSIAVALGLALWRAA